MSLETWKQEFYDVDAQDVAAERDMLKCLEHSIKKWNGLTEDNLEKHECFIDTIDGTAAVSDGWDYLYLDSESCSLCILSTRISIEQEIYDDCSPCPLKNCQKEYLEFSEDYNPMPMIELLQGAKKNVESEKV